MRTALHLQDSATAVGWVRTMWAGLGHALGASRLFTTHGLTIANDVHDIVPGLSFPVIVTSFGTREQGLRNQAFISVLGYIPHAPLRTLIRVFYKVSYPNSDFAGPDRVRAHPTTSPPSSEARNRICHVCLRGAR